MAHFPLVKQAFLGVIILIFVCGMNAQISDDQIRMPDRKNSSEQIDKPYLIFISIDGFRQDYFEKYQPDFLMEIREKGVSTPAMLPSFPSSTFPNHYTLVTGLLPSHHGVVGNAMWDRETGERFSIRNKKAVTQSKWYGGMPLWVLAERRQMLTACFYWPGSEAPIGGYLPTYYYPYSENKTAEDRIARVVDWLQLPEEQRPHFITFYVPQVDHAGHNFGPDADETGAAVRLVDGILKDLVKAVDHTGLPVNYILVSDHGMTALDQENPIRLPKIDPEKVAVSGGGVYTSIFVKNRDNIKEVYNYFSEESSDQYTVYLKENIPKKYSFSTENDLYNRIGDIVLMAAPPYYFTNHKPKAGGHGYHPEDSPDMKTIFIAWGPDIQKGKTIASFQNIHIFPLMAALLKLDYEHSIDGDQRLIPQVLKSE